MIVVAELSEGEELVPVILPLICEESKVLLQLLIDAFHLPIRLGMVGSRTRHLEAEKLTKFVHELVDKLWTSVAVHNEGQPMQLPDMHEVEPL